MDDDGVIFAGVTDISAVDARDLDLTAANGCAADRGDSAVLLRHGEIHAAWCDRGKQIVLIEGHLCFVIWIFQVVLAEPIGEASTYLIDTLALLLTRNSRTRAA